MIAKIALVLSAFVVVASAGGHAHGGHSNSYRKQDDFGNYNFGYDIVDPIGAKNFRKETGDAWGNKAGSYGLHDVDGRLRVVEYVADKHGFRAKIRTNEPGTANKDAAAAVYNGPDPAGFSHSHIPAGKVAPQYNPGPVAYGHGGYGHGFGHGGLHGAYGHAFPAYAPYAGGYGYGRGAFYG